MTTPAAGTPGAFAGAALLDPHRRAFVLLGLGLGGCVSTVMEGLPKDPPFASCFSDVIPAATRPAALRVAGQSHDGSPR
jgi:hypothetical protein